MRAKSEKLRNCETAKLRDFGEGKGSGWTMQSSTAALIFVCVFVGIALLYCLFRVCGGRITDILSCNFCRGPCCDCWGVGGRADADEFRPVSYPPGYGPGGGYPPYPAHYPSQFLPPLSHLGPSRSQPPIVIVNRRGDESSSSSSEYSSSDEDTDKTGTRKPPRQPKRSRRSQKRDRDASIYSRRDRTDLGEDHVLNSTRSSRHRERDRGRVVVV